MLLSRHQNLIAVALAAALNDPTANAQPPAGGDWRPGEIELVD